MLFHKKNIINHLVILIILSFLQTNANYANDEKVEVYQENKPTFYSLRSEIATVSETEFFDFLRISIIQQPEYSYALSDVVEKKMLLKFQQRHRYPIYR